VEDVARALTALARTGPGPIRLWEACGPEVFTLADLVRHAGRWGRCERVIVPLPAALGKMQAMLMEYLPGKTLMSRDNVDSMRVDNVASNELPGLEALGIQATALSQVFDIP
jgi:NADH dehydrogenase